MSDKSEPVLPYASPSTPRRRRSPWIAALGAVGTAVAAGGTFIAISAATAQPLMGATRSARLQWEDRRAQIEQTIGQAAVPGPTDER